VVVRVIPDVRVSAGQKPERRARLAAVRCQAGRWAAGLRAEEGDPAL
jgi:hypothetical protein